MSSKTQDISIQFTRKQIINNGVDATVCAMEALEKLSGLFKAIEKLSDDSIINKTGYDLADDAHNLNDCFREDFTTLAGGES